MDKFISLKTQILDEADFIHELLVKSLFQISSKRFHRCTYLGFLLPTKALSVQDFWGMKCIYIHYETQTKQNPSSLLAGETYIPLLTKSTCNL